MSITKNAISDRSLHCTMQQFGDGQECGHSVSRLSAIHKVAANKFAHCKQAAVSQGAAAAFALPEQQVGISLIIKLYPQRARGSAAMAQHMQLQEYMLID